MRTLDVRFIQPDDAPAQIAWRNLLHASRLTAEASADVIFGVYDGSVLAATGARFGNILKMIAVSPAYQGGEVFNALLDALLKDAFKQGETKLFVYTKPATSEPFRSIGFSELIQVEDDLIFMERGQPDFDAYLSNLRLAAIPSKRAGAVVMHANPFTNGHLHLIRTALESCDVVYVFVLSEDRGLIPAAVRFALVEEGVRPLNVNGTRVVTLPTNDYLVSSQTFPAYFLPDSDDAIRIQARLDALLFRDRIAPVLEITVRFVGEEPFSAVTGIYNNVLDQVLQVQPGFHLVPRLAAGGLPISASAVRRHWLNGNTTAVKPLVPPSTYTYLLANRPRIASK